MMELVQPTVPSRNQLHRPSWVYPKRLDEVFVIEAGLEYRSLRHPMHPSYLPFLLS
jgi:hypothetical protein